MSVQATGLSTRSISPITSVHKSSVHHKHFLTDTCLSCWLKNSVVIAKVSAPDAAGWNPPDWATQASAALHVYTNPSTPTALLYLSLFPPFCSKGKQRVNRQWNRVCSAKELACKIQCNTIDNRQQLWLSYYSWCIIRIDTTCNLNIPFC